MGDQPRPGDIYWRAIEPYWDEVSIYDGPSVFQRDLARVPQGIASLLSAHWCQSEVCNGGFHQFFYNSTGVLAPEAVTGFRAIGMTTCASLIKEAMAFFGDIYPRERQSRVDVLERYALENPGPKDQFWPLDKRFFEELEKENGGFQSAADRYASGLAPPSQI